MRVAVDSGPELSVAIPTEVCDLEELRVLMWSPLPGGRFFFAMKSENENDITRYDLVLNWAELLKRKLDAAK